MNDDDVDASSFWGGQITFRISEQRAGEFVELLAFFFHFVHTEKTSEPRKPSIPPPPSPTSHS